MPNLGDMVVRIVGDNSELDRALTDSEKKTKKTLTNLKEAYRNIGIAVGAATVFVKALISAWAESDKAQIQLNYALQGNTKTFKGASDRIIQYAIELAKAAGICEDMVKAQFAVLAGFGLTETQMKDVMEAAVNLSSTGLVTLDEAIIALGGSFEGSIGRIGRYVPALKDLTKQQLEAGKAVEYVNEHFKGTAEIIANTLTGRINQLKVAIEDLKKAAGQSLALIIQPALKPIADFLNGISAVVVETFAMYAAQKAVENGSATLAQRILVVNAALAENAAQIAEINKRQNTMVQSFGTGIMTSKGFRDLQNQQQALQNVRYELQEGLKAAQAQQKAQDDAQAKADEIAAAKVAATTAEADAIEYEEKKQKALNDQLDREHAAWSEQSAAEEVVRNAKKNALAEEIQANTERMENEAEAHQMVMDDIAKEIQANKERTDNEIEAAQMVAEEEKKARAEAVAAWEGYSGKVLEILSALASAINAKNQREVKVQEQRLDAETKARIDSLQEQLDAGLINEQEYHDKLEIIEKDAAKKKAKLEYDAALVSWQMSLALAIAGAAQAVINGLLTQPFVPNGIAAGILAGILGAVQVAAINAAKPLPPALAEGGIILPRPGGTLVRVGEAGRAEMILPLDRYMPQGVGHGLGGTAQDLGDINLTVKLDSDVLFRKIFPATRTGQILIDGRAIVS